MINENLKEYEISFLLVSPENEKTVADVLAKNGAEVFHQKSIGEISLAYPIKKHASAVFGFYYFRAGMEAVEKINADLRLAQGVLRFLIVTPPIKQAIPQVSPRQSANRKPAEVPVLSNEALEEKLEEILK